MIYFIFYKVVGKPKPKDIKSIVIYKQQLFTLEERVECRDVSWQTEWFRCTDTRVSAK